MTAALVFVMGRASGLDAPASVLVGLLASLSSTAIILRLLQDRSEVTSPHGKGAMAILIFQDIAFVPMMLVIPFLAGEAGGSPLHEIGLLVVKVIGIWLVIWLLAPRLMPRMMTQIARTESNELFLLTTGVICFAVAYLTSLLGLSLALGAFIAGLILSSTWSVRNTLRIW